MQAGAEFPKSIEQVRVVPKQGSPITLTLGSVRPTRGALLVTFVDVAGRDATQPLVGARLEIDAQSLPPLADGEFYLYEILGAHAIDEEGRALGIADGLLDNHGQDLLVLHDPAGVERLLPLVEGTLIHFDRVARIAHLHVPAGLWGE